MAKLTERMVEQLRCKYVAGDAGALLDAVDFCARAGMLMPLWVVNAFCARYEDWRMFRARSLDKAFGVSRPKKMHIKRAATRERLKSRVVLEVLRLHREEQMPIDQDLFARVGKVLKIGGGLANKIYYGDNSWRELLPHFQLLRDPEIS